MILDSNPFSEGFTQYWTEYYDFEENEDEMIRDGLSQDTLTSTKRLKWF